MKRRLVLLATLLFAPQVDAQATPRALVVWVPGDSAPILPALMAELRAAELDVETRSGSDTSWRERAAGWLVLGPEAVEVVVVSRDGPRRVARVLREDDLSSQALRVVEIWRASLIGGGDVPAPEPQTELAPAPVRRAWFVAAEVAMLQSLGAKRPEHPAPNLALALGRDIGRWSIGLDIAANPLAVREELPQGTIDARMAWMRLGVSVRLGRDGALLWPTLGAGAFGMAGFARGTAAEGVRGRRVRSHSGGDIGSAGHSIRLGARTRLDLRVRMHVMGRAFALRYAGTEDAAVAARWGRSLLDAGLRLTWSL
ncbi:MAG: hypothetical protein AAF645_10830 [Myxococcota bacterium]